MKEKLYPFSTAKHAHDIEYRRNRVYIEIREYEDDLDRKLDDTYFALRDLYEKLTELLEAVLNSRDGRVCYLNGKQIGLAKECVFWAQNRRCSCLM